MKPYKLLFSAIVIISSAACKKGDAGITGLNTLVKIDSIVAGKQCANGGLAIKSGLDSNRNNILDDNEISSTNYICNGNNGTNGNSDHQIFIRAVNAGFYNIGQTVATYASIPDFNIANYPGVDSVVLLSNPYTSAGSQVKIELYNMTDQVAIANSEIIASESTYYNYYHASSNFLSSLPNKTVTLGVRLTTTKSTDNAFTGNAVLLLYRK